MSRSYTLWFAPVVGLMGCQAPDEEFIDIEFGEDESADADDASPGDGAPNTLADVERPTEAPPPYPDALLVSPAAEWRYLPQPTCVTAYPKDSQNRDWRAIAFDTTGWSALSRAELGYGDGDEITTIPFGPSATKKCITQFFRHTFEITAPNSPTLYDSLVLQLLRDDGAAVYLNGELLKRDNLPSVFGINTVASSTVEDSDEDRFFVYTGLPNKLVAGTNVIAVEVHQRSASNPDLGINLALLGRLKADATHVTRWFVSAEATISEQTPSSALGGDDECKIDGASDTNNTDGDQVCLAKWNLSGASGIPANATVLAAHLDTDVNNGSPERFEVYKLNKNWSEFTATWNNPGTAPDWATSGHFGTSDLDMTDPSPVTVINSLGEGRRIYALPPKVVQGWAGSSTAPGIAFFNTDHENGIDLDASGVGIELVVTYKPASPP
jgi:hypothetical protein